MKAPSNLKSSSLPSATAASKTTVKASTMQARASKPAGKKSEPQKRSTNGTPDARPKVKSSPAAQPSQQVTVTQDRVTLVAFYTLFGAVLAGIIYFLSLLFFI